MQQIIEAMIEVGKRLYRQGLLAGSEGNISIRWETASGRSTCLITASGVCKGFLTPEMIIPVPLEKREAGQVDGQSSQAPDRATGYGSDPVTTANKENPRYRPSSETSVHLAAYRNTDACAVIHAHPVYATAFSLLPESMFPDDIMPEAIAFLGPIARVPYAVPGTDQLADAFQPYWKDHRVFLMENHGVLCLGRNIEEALFRLESLERYAHIVYTATSIGTIKRLSTAQVDELRCRYQ